ncbi:hypothetical protein cyc_00994 [Cyclospora cayetanensis]|uniref:Uncharacterized protein n=1 Tax=Cyclospora cayetanensis TaxID=88456 RepID=A0A1D3D253_9EIME|nr:hypothetical protein cyc_00994 [Cyclospora cayetanensis]
MERERSFQPEVGVFQRPLPPRLRSADIFQPNLLRQRAAQVAASALGGKGKNHPGNDLEEFIESLLRRPRVPAPPKKGPLVVGVRNKCGSGESSSGSRVMRTRCRTVLQVYALLDPLGAGYVDPETACGCIAAAKRDSEELGVILLHVLEDMLPFVSSRGVIEKSVFLKALREWIEVDASGTGPYYALRLSTNPVSTAYKEGLPCTNPAGRSFYRGTYIPQGLEDKLQQLEAENRHPSKLMHHLAPNSGQRIRAMAPGNLEAHIKETAIRREKRIFALKDALNKRELEGSSRAALLSRVRREETELLRELALPPDEPFSEHKKQPKELHRKGEDEAGAQGEKEKAEEDSTEQKRTETAVDRKTPKKREKPLDLGPIRQFDFWVMQEGQPRVRPLELRETLRASPLPQVPLDGLSPETPKFPVAKTRGSRFHDEEMGRFPSSAGECSRTSVGTLSGSSPYALPSLPDLFPHLAEKKHHQHQYHKAHPPLTPGLPSTFKSGFYRERMRESSEERRMRLGQAKGGPEDPLLWDTNTSDFKRGLLQSPKRQLTPPRAMRRRAQISHPW